jgi:predicted phosphodiesterase
MISSERIKEIIEFNLQYGDGKTLEQYKIKNTYLDRIRRLYKEKISDNLDDRQIIKDIVNRYTPQELRAIANGGRVIPGQTNVPIVDFTGERVRFGLCSDTHFGSLFCKDELWEQTVNVFKKEKVEFVVHTGDITEGMSGRPGHIYELSHMGYDSQRDKAIEMLLMWPGQYYFIDGNHDRWYIKSSGARMVPDICKLMGEKAVFIGHDTGTISLKGRATIGGFHGEDGSTYALSYRIQKLVESMSGGSKPNILVTGHDHKHGYFFVRNIHCFGAGCIQLQTDWMRATRKEAHPGFWTIDAWIGKAGISKISPTFYPFYQ